MRLIYLYAVSVRPKGGCRSRPLEYHHPEATMTTKVEVREVRSVKGCGKEVEKEVGIVCAVLYKLRFKPYTYVIYIYVNIHMHMYTPVYASYTWKSCVSWHPAIIVLYLYIYTFHMLFLAIAII